MSQDLPGIGSVRRSQAELDYLQQIKKNQITGQQTKTNIDRDYLESIKKGGTQQQQQGVQNMDYNSISNPQQQISSYQPTETQYQPSIQPQFGSLESNNNFGLPSNPAVDEILKSINKNKQDVYQPQNTTQQQNFQFNQAQDIQNQQIQPSTEYNTKNALQDDQSVSIQNLLNQSKRLLGKPIDPEPIAQQFPQQQQSNTDYDTIMKQQNQELQYTSQPPNATSNYISNPQIDEILKQTLKKDPTPMPQYYNQEPAQQYIQPQQQQQQYGQPIYFNNNGNIDDAIRRNLVPQQQQQFTPLNQVPAPLNQIGESKLFYQMDCNYILTKCMQEDKPFCDSEFPPCKEAIGGTYPVINWKRPKDIYNNMFNLFPKFIEPDSIIQGDLGDCYLIGAIAAIAERSSRVKNLFQLQHLNKPGCYGVKICWKGVWNEVIVDDYFPVKENQPAFSRSTNNRENDIWILILEKAWAKLHGNYCQIDSGLTREVLHDLLGAPCKTFFLNPLQQERNQDIWTRIKDATEKGYIVTCIKNPSRNNVQNEGKYGVAPGHVCVVVSCHEFQINENFSKKIIKLRNPWKQQDQQAKEIDINLNDIPQNLQQQLAFPENTNLFIQDFNDFIYCFSNIQICYMYDNYIYNGVKFTSSNQDRFKFFSIQIPVNGTYCFSVSQKSIRTENFQVQDQITEQQFYQKIWLIVCQQGSADPIIALQGNQRDITSFKYLENAIVLEQGKYYAFVQIDWNRSQETPESFGFGCYGVAKTEITEIDKTQCEEFPKLVEDLYKRENYFECA